MKSIITCEEAETLLSGKMDVHLSLSKRLLLQMHLMMCRKCIAIGRQMWALRKTFLGLESASSQDEIRLPKASQKRIQQELRDR